jgi:hypothetical protein
MEQVVALAERTFGRSDENFDLLPRFFGKAVGEVARCYLAAYQLVGEPALLNRGEGVTKRRYLLLRTARAHTIRPRAPYNWSGCDSRIEMGNP